MPSFNAFAYLIGNLLLFAPMALYNQIRFSKKQKRGFFIVLFTSISGELLQLFVMYITRINFRVIDVDDLILNVLVVFFRGF